MMSKENTCDEDLKKYVFYIKTVQASAMRILIEALKEILSESNFKFDSSGIRMITMDPSHTVLAHLKLDAENFEVFHCKRAVTIGIGLMNMYKLVKTLNNNSILTLYLLESDMTRIGIHIEHTDKMSITNYKLDLMDLSNDIQSYPDAEFSSVITMSSSDFQKICRDMYHLSDVIEIKNVNDKLFLSCKGDFAEQETIICSTSEDESNVQIVNNTKDIIQGEYSVKYLVLFTKCTNLSNVIELHIKNDFPLILKYTCASLGEIKLVLAPRSNHSK